MSTAHRLALGPALGAALSVVIVAGAMLSAPSYALAQSGFGYGGGGRADVAPFCRATGSQFMPYVRITIPTATIERLLARGGGILPDTQGNCPSGISITEYIFDRIQSVFRF